MILHRSIHMAKRLGLIGLLAMLIPACTHRPTPLAPQTSDKLPVICRLVSRDQTITISASGNGPVYSVQDARGLTVLSYASREELRIRHPDLSQQLDTMMASSDARQVSDRLAPREIPRGAID